MAIRGKRPNISLVNAITGGRRPENALEPVPTGEPVRPAFVTGKAKKLWEQYAPDLIAQGILTSWDSHSFGRLCCDWAEYEKNPAAFNAARKSEMRKHETQFGLGDPSGRTRLKIGGRDKDADNGERFYG